MLQGCPSSGMIMLGVLWKGSDMWPWEPSLRCQSKNIKNNRTRHECVCKLDQGGAHQSSIPSARAWAGHWCRRPILAAMALFCFETFTKMFDLPYFSKKHRGPPPAFGHWCQREAWCGHPGRPYLSLALLIDIAVRSNKSQVWIAIEYLPPIPHFATENEWRKDARFTFKYIHIRYVTIAYASFCCNKAWRTS